MLMNALKMQEAGSELIFTDKAEIGAWAQKAVSQALQLGIIKGYEDGTFGSNRNITRAEMAMMIAKTLKLPNEENAITSFTGDKEIPVWAKGAEAATILLNMLDDLK